jgi:hypothetical protein
MKTIALLSICAAFALADQDPNKKAATDVTPANAKQANAKPAATKTASPKAVHAPAAAEPRRNLNQPAKMPVEPKLTPAQQAAAALPTVPAGAQEVGANLYRYTDPQGKRWMYRKTPFGVSKWEEKEGEEQAPAAETPSEAHLTATDLGDSVQFERQTPFGPQKWTRKKSEMTGDEKAALAQQAGNAKPPEKQ